MYRNNSGKGLAGGTLLLVAGVVALLIWQPWGDQAPAAGGISPTGGGNTVVNTCPGDITPDLTVRATNKDTGIPITGEPNSYRKKGQLTWTAFTGGDTVTNLEYNSVAGGTEYEFVIGLNTTDDWTNNYYGDYFIYKSTCDPVKTIESTAYNDDTSLTLTFLNTLGNNEPEAVTAGEQPWITLRMETTSDQYFGNPTIAANSLLSDANGHAKAYPNLVCLRLNNTDYDGVLDFVIDGVSMKRVGNVPRRVTMTGGSDTFCYEAPVITDIQTDLKFRLDADDGINPGNSTQAFPTNNSKEISNVTDSNIVIFVSGNYYLEQDTAELKWGYEDIDGNITGSFVQGFPLLLT